MAVDNHIVRSRCLYSVTVDGFATASRDEAALFDIFVRDESATLLRLAWGLTGDRGAAEDLVQATLERVWTHWPRVSNKGRAGAYARRVALTLFLTSRLRFWWGERVAASPPDATIDDDSDVVLSRRTVLTALSDLPPRQRAVLVLRYLDDRSEAETADALGCALGTVKSQAARALTALRTNPDLRDLWSPSFEGDHNG